MLQPHHVTVRRVAERYSITDKPARLFIQNLEARGVLRRVPGYAFDGHKLAVWERVENAKAKQD